MDFDFFLFCFELEITKPNESIMNVDNQNITERLKPLQYVLNPQSRERGRKVCLVQLSGIRHAGISCKTYKNADTFTSHCRVNIRYPSGHNARPQSSTSRSNPPSPYTPGKIFHRVFLSWDEIFISKHTLIRLQRQISQTS